MKRFYQMLLDYPFSFSVLFSAIVVTIALNLL